MFAGCLASFFDDSGFALALPGRPAVCDSVIVVRLWYVVVYLRGSCLMLLFIVIVPLFALLLLLLLLYC